MGSVRTILANLFTALGGFFLLALTVGVGFALYLATAPDSASAPADADAVSSHPLMQAQPVAVPASNVIRIASASAAGTQSALPSGSSRSTRARELQKALARMGCYNGPISGTWSNASKDAMRSFLKTVNAELPVDAPDDALVALIVSNEAAHCSAGRAIETGALGTGTSGSSLPAAAEHAASIAAKPIPPLPSAKSDQTNDGPTLLGRAWAPQGMLIPPKDPAPAPSASAAADTLRSPTVERTASNNLTATDATPAPAPVQQTPIHFEGGTPLPATQPVDPSPAAVADRPHAETPAKPKKTKTAKRRPATDDGVEATINKGIDTLQRSLASMF